MRFAIVDRNRITRASLAEWLQIQDLAGPEDHSKNQIFTYGTAEDVLRLVPTLDAVWLEVTENVHRDVRAIRKRSRIIGDNPRPVVVLLTDRPDPAVTAFAVVNHLLTVETSNIADLVNSYHAVALLLKNDPPQPEQIFRHTCTTGPNGPCLRGEAVAEVSLVVNTLVPLPMKIARTPAVVYDFMSLAVPPGRPQSIDSILVRLPRSQFHSFWLCEDVTRRSLITNVNRIVDALDWALSTPEGSKLGYTREEIFRSETVPGKGAVYIVNAKSIREHEDRTKTATG
ncbi:MAG: hypothetical protein ACR2IF_07115 [Terriglobales bacterium]